MMRGGAALLLLGLGGWGAAGAQEVLEGGGPASQASYAPASLDHPGRELFERNCAACHGAGPGDDGAPMLPGTAALERKYRGQVPAALELRGGLGAEVIAVFVRGGSGTMPSFRKSELSDAQVHEIAAYLEASAAAHLARD